MIILNNKVVDPTKNVVEATPRPIVQSVSQPAAPLPQPIVETPSTNKTNPTSSHTLIVNGVEKKITKSSSYLLDMMTVHK
jgi:hypothetical protein